MDLILNCYLICYIDVVDEMELGKLIVCMKNVMINELFFWGYFLGNLVMLGVLIIEILVQVVLVLIFKLFDFYKKMVYLGWVCKVKFCGMVWLGDVLKFYIDMEKVCLCMGIVKVVVMVDDWWVCSVELIFIVVE